MSSWRHWTSFVTVSGDFYLWQSLIHHRRGLGRYIAKKPKQPSTLFGNIFILCATHIRTVRSQTSCQGVLKRMSITCFSAFPKITVIFLRLPFTVRYPDYSLPQGIKQLHPCNEAAVDICFAHGQTRKWGGDLDGRESTSVVALAVATASPQTCREFWP